MYSNIFIISVCTCWQNILKVNICIGNTFYYTCTYTILLAVIIDIYFIWDVQRQLADQQHNPTEYNITSTILCCTGLYDTKETIINTDTSYQAITPTMLEV